MAEQTEKLVTLLEMQNKDVLRKLDQFERASKKAFDNSRRPLRQFNRSMGDAKKSTDTLRNAFAQSARSVAVLEGPLGGIAGRFGAIGAAVSAANPAIAAAGVLIAALTAASGKAVLAFQAFEKQQLVLQQVLRATGGSAGRTAEQIETLAQEIGFGTLGSTTEAREAAAQLLTFRSIALDTFDRTLRLAQDLATVGFGTLKTSAVQLGKALEDPEQGLSALRRVGVSFSEAQRDMIRGFMETGRVAEAQTAILDAVEKQVGGAGTASGQGLAGAYDTLSEATQILLERWGQQIAEAFNLRDAILGIAEAVDAVNQRAGLAGQLRLVDAQIADNRAGPDRSDVVGPSILPEGAGDIVREERLQALLRQRAEILRQLDRQRREEDDAYVRAIEVQKEAEAERIDAAVRGLEKEIEAARLSTEEKRIAAEIAKAGVTADSQEGQRIADLTRQLFAAQENTKAREKSAGAGDKQEKAYQRVIDKLRLEEAQLGLTSTQIRVMNEQQAAGVIADSARGREIDALIVRLEAYQERQERVTSVTSFFEDQASSAFSSVTGLIDTGNDALDRFLQAMAEASFQALAFQRGPLFDLFSLLSSGGGASPIADLFSGWYAKGGDIPSGKVGIAGEAGPELITGPATVTPMSKVGGGGVTYAPVYQIDARGSQMTEAQFRAIVDENNRRVVPQIALSAVGQANRVSTNPAFRTR